MSAQQSTEGVRATKVSESEVELNVSIAQSHARSLIHQDAAKSHRFDHHYAHFMLFHATQQLIKLQDDVKRLTDLAAVQANAITDDSEVNLEEARGMWMSLPDHLVKTIEKQQEETITIDLSGVEEEL